MTSAGRARRDDQPRAGLRPAAEARRPAISEAPARRRAGLDRPHQRKLGPVQLPHDRQPWKVAQRRLMRRRQVMEVEDVRPAGSRPSQRPPPDRDQPLIGLVIDRRKDAIRPARPILIGGLKRNDPRQRIGHPQRRRIIDRHHVETREERRRMPRLARAPKRTSSQPHLPTRRRQRAAQGTRNLRRTPTRKEKQRRHDPTAQARHQRSAHAPHPRVSTPAGHRQPFSPTCLCSHSVLLLLVEAGRGPPRLGKKPRGAVSAARRIREPM